MLARKITHRQQFQLPPCTRGACFVKCASTSILTKPRNAFAWVDRPTGSARSRAQVTRRMPEDALCVGVPQTSLRDGGFAVLERVPKDVLAVLRRQLGGEGGDQFGGLVIDAGLDGVPDERMSRVGEGFLH
jgi:hypothetical protein